MSQLIVEDAGWAAVLADPELARARRLLSFHELRAIIKHARTAKAGEVEAKHPLQRMVELDEETEALSPGYMDTTVEQGVEAVAAARAERQVEAGPGEAVERDAARWRALLGCARIRMFGSANIDPKTGEIKNPDEWVHFGAEFWSVYTSYEEMGRPDDTNQWGIHALTALADHVIMRSALSASTSTGKAG